MKTIIITGGTSGIGLNIAKYFYKRDFNIAIAGIFNKTAFKKLNVIFNPEKSLILNLDLIKKNNIKKFIRLSKNKFSTIDVLVNCAGLQHVSPICKFSDKIWEYIININLNTPFKMIKEVLPIMRKNKWGRIINISSVHGSVGSQFKAGYVSSKHGLVGLTKVVALETAKENITCNSVCPGFVLTELIQDQIDLIAKKKKISNQKAEVELLKEKQPSLQFVKKDDVASLIYYLSSEAAKQITGSNIPIDGAWTSQ